MTLAMSECSRLTWACNTEEEGKSLENAGRAHFA
jgi:hypothetical protein